ncbi:MAG TPA: ComF family protein [Acidobacteriota bacterium]|nr:ComF family protein [Acidobacteriota bacterium]
MKIFNAARCFLGALLFPQTCVVCGTWVINPQFSPLCRTCLNSLETHQYPACYYCGAAVPGSLSDLEAVCGPCRSETRLFDWARSTGPYEGKLREVIRKYKFDGYRRLAYPLAARLANTYLSERHQFQADFIVPVPLHWRRKRERGFDQTLALARVLGARLGLPVLKAVRRVRHTLPQFGLDRVERKKNVERAFRISGVGHRAGARLLLIDDVMTTGATINEICRLFRETGEVDEIMVLTVARAQLVRDWF